MVCAILWTYMFIINKSTCIIQLRSWYVLSYAHTYYIINMSASIIQFRSWYVLSCAQICYIINMLASIIQFRLWYVLPYVISMWARRIQLRSWYVLSFEKIRKYLLLLMSAVGSLNVCNNIWLKSSLYTYMKICPINNTVLATGVSLFWKEATFLSACTREWPVSSCCTCECV